MHINLAYALGGLWNRTRNRQMLDEALGLIQEMGVPEHIPAAELARETILATMSHRGAAAAATE
jgi:hypothetical protein